MRREQDIQEQPRTFHSGNTDPFLPQLTAPLSPLTLSGQLPEQPQTRMQRFGHGLHLLLNWLVRKINQILWFALLILQLALVARFIFDAFNDTTSLFAHWVMQLTDLVTLPFTGIAPTMPYYGYLINVSVLVAIVVYFLAVLLVTRFLKMLVD